MSKKINNSRKSSKKNFKIENLEPRLMMDAASGFEVEKFDTYVDSFESISSKLGEGLSKTLDNVEKIDSADLGLTEKFDSFTALLGKTSETIKSEVTDYVGKIFSNALDEAKEKIDNLNVADFVKYYVQPEIKKLEKDGYKGVSIEADGNKLVFTYSLSKTQNLSNVKFGTKSWGSLSMDGATQLECAAEIKVSVNLDGNDDKVILSSSDDFTVETFKIENLSASIKQLGMNLKFMNMNLIEVDDGSEDISLKYENSEFKRNIDLEFKLVGADNLPFGFAEGEYIKISNSTGTLEATLPEFQLKESFSLASIFESLNSIDAPFIGKTNLLGTDETSIANSIVALNDCWANITVALQNAIENVKSTTDAAVNEIQINGTKFAESLQKLASAKLENIKKVLSGLKLNVPGTEGLNIFSILEGYSIADIKLPSSEIAFTLDFSPNFNGLNSIQLGGETIGDLTITSDIAVNFVAKYENGELTLNTPSFGNFGVKADLSEYDYSKLPFKINGVLSLTAQKNKEGTLEWNTTVPEFEMNDGYAFDSILNSLKDVSVPFLNNDFNVVDLVKQYNDCWGNITASLRDAVEPFGEKIQLNASKFVKSLQDLASSKLDDLKENLDGLKLNIPGYGDIDLLAVIDGKAFNDIDLTNKELKFSLALSPKLDKLTSADIGGVTFDNLSFASQFVVNFEATFTNNSLNFESASFGNLSVTADLNNKIPAGLPFTVEGEFKISAEINENGKLIWNSEVPKFKMNEGLSVENILDGLSKINIPFFTNWSFKLGNKSYTVSDIATEINDFWSYVSGSLVNSVNESKINLQNLKTTLTKAISDKYNNAAGFVSNIMIASSKLADKVENQFSIYDVQDKVQELTAKMGRSFGDFIDLKVNESNCVTLFFKPVELAKLISVGEFDLRDVSSNVIIAVDVTFTLDTDDKISFERIALRNIDLNFEKSDVTEVMFGGVGFSLEDGSFTLNTSVTSDFRLNNLDAKINYESLDLKTGYIGNLHLGKGSIGYVNGTWAYPTEFDDISKLFSEKTFSLSSILKVAENIPLVGNTPFSFGSDKKAYTVAQIAEQVDSVWESLSAAMQGVVSKVGNAVDNAEQKFALDLQNLKTNFEKYMGSSLDETKNLFSGLELGDVNLLKSIDSGKTKIKELVYGNNEIALNFTTNSADIKSLFGFNGLDCSVAVNVSIKLHISIDEDGRVSFSSVDFDDYTVNLNIPENLFISNKKIGLKYSVQNGWTYDKIQFKTSIDAGSLTDLISESIIQSIPGLNNQKLKLLGVEYSITDLLNNFKDVVADVSSAITINGSELKFESEKFKQVFEVFKNSGEKATQQVLSGISVIGGKIESIENSANAGLAYVNGIIENNTDIEGEVLTIVLTSETVHLPGNLEILPFEINNSALDVALAVELTVVEGEINVDLKEISLAADIKNCLPEGLPVSVENGLVKISYDKGSWNYAVPSFKFDSEALSLTSLCNFVESANIKFFDGKCFKINETALSISDVLKKIDSAWTCASAALYNAFSFAENMAEMKLESLKSGFNELAGDSIKQLLSQLNVVSLENVDNSTSFMNENDKINLLDNEMVSKVVKLENGVYDLTVQFVPNIGLGDVNFELFTLSGLKADVSVSVNVRIEIANGKIRFKSVDLKELELGVSRSFDKKENLDFNLGGTKFNALLGGDFSCGLAITSNGLDKEKSHVALSCDSMSLKYGSINVLQYTYTEGSNEKINIGFNFEKGWEIPTGILDDLKKSFEKAVSIDSVLAFITESDNSFINQTFGLGDNNFSIKKAVNDISTVWNTVSTLLSFNVLEEIQEGIFGLSVSTLQDAFGGELGSLKQVFSSVILANEESKIDFISGDATENLKISKKDDIVKLIFKLRPESSVEFKYSTYNFGSVNLEFEFAVEFSVSMNDSGKLSVESVDLSENALTVNVLTLTNTNLNDLPITIDPESDSECLQFVLTKGLAVNTNLIVNDSFELTDIANCALDVLLSGIENIRLPFVDKLEFNVGGKQYNIVDIAKNLDVYRKLAFKALGSAVSTVEGISLDYAELGKKISGYLNSSLYNQEFISNLKLLNSVYSKGMELSSDKFISLLNNAALNESIQLSQGAQTLVFALSAPTMNIDKSVDLGLFKLGQLDVDFTVLINVEIDVDEDGKISFQGVTLNSVELNATADLPENIKFGLFKPEVENGEFKFNVTVNKDSNNNWSLGDSCHAGVSYSSLQLKYGDNTIGNALGEGELKYNIKTSEWTLPSELKKFTSLKSETLVNQIHIVLNTLQTALRGLIESKTKLDFLDGSVDKIVDFVEKVESFIYGDGKQKGLLEKDNGEYVCKLNLKELEDQFNKLWIQKFEISDSDLVDVNGNKRTPISCAVTDTGLELNFYLAFCINKEFGLNFGNLLSKANGIANVTTNGYVSVGGLAGMDFSIKVDFKNNSLSDSLTLKDIDVDFTQVQDESVSGNGAEISKSGNKNVNSLTVQQQYLEFKLDEDGTFENDLTIYILDPDEGNLLDSVKIKQNQDVKNSDNWYDVEKKSVNVHYTQSNQLCITANYMFDVKNGDAVSSYYSNTKLSSSNLQSVTEVSPESGLLKLSYKLCENEKEFGQVQELLIDLTEIENLVKQQIITATDWKNRINEYLSLQKSENNNLVNNKDVHEERSLMNTFGVYVIDVVEADGKLTSVRFGCDARKLVEYEIDSNRVVKKQYFLCDAKSSKITYMRMSGELHLSKKIASNGLRGAFITDSSSNNSNSEAVSKQKFIELMGNLSNDNAAMGAVSKLIEQYPELQNDFVVSYMASDKTDCLEIILKPKGSDNQKTVRVSDSVLKIDIRLSETNTTTIFVDTANCTNVGEVAAAINSVVLQNNSLSSYVYSVSAVDEKIIFATKADVTVDFIDCSSLKVASKEDNESSEDSGVVNANAHKFDDFRIGEDEYVDFQLFIGDAGDSSTLISVINEINEKCLKKYEIRYRNGVDSEFWDHFEIRYKDEQKNASQFELVNIGSSTVLQKLGFSANKSIIDADGYQCIIGSALLGYDWSSLIKLDDAKLNLFAQADFELGVEVTYNSCSDDGSCITFFLDSNSSLRTYGKGGFFAIEDNYFEIQEVSKNKDDGLIRVIISNKSIEKNAFNEVYSRNCTVTYIASADISIGFVGVDLLASGKLGIDARFALSKAKTDADNDILGFHVEYELSPAAESSNEFKFDAYSDLINSSETLISGSVGFANKNSFELTTSLNTDGLKNAIGNFENFSIEQLFAVLENLIEKLGEITKKTENTKIPVINKSVGDLVNIANDLNDVVKKLRAEKITSIQHFADLLNTYLEKFNLVATNGCSKLFDLEYENGAINIILNLQKDFKTSHQFNFGTAGNGVNGNVNLEVSGGFWISISASLNISNKIELILNDVIQFGADIEIAGDNLSFALGIDSNKDNSLLRNLISVGSDQNKAFVYGKACLFGSLGKANSSVTDISTPTFTIPVAIYGKLPINVCNMSLGDVLIGKCNGSTIFFSDCSNFTECKKIVADTIELYKNGLKNNLELSKDSLSISSNGFNFGIKTEKQDSESNGKLVADFSEVYDRIQDLADFANMDWFDQIKLAVAGLNNLFDVLESKINNGMADSIKSVPVVGSALSSGVDFLSVLKNKVLDPFSKFVYETSGLSVETVAKKFNELFGGYFLTPEVDEDGYAFNWLSGDWNRVSNAGTWYRKTSDSAEWFFNLGGIYTYGSGIAFDFGLPGLGLESNAGLNLSLSWSLEFGFGISKDNGFYFIFGDGDEINVRADATLDGSIKGRLAGLGLMLDVDKGNSGVSLSFGVDLGELTGTENYKAQNIFDKKDNSGELVNHEYGQVTLSNAFSKPKFDYDASVGIKAEITVGFGSDIGTESTEDDTPKFPNIKGVFEFEWGRDENTGLYDVNTLGFTGLNFDMGSFISGVLGPIVKKIQSVVEPLESLIDFLTTPFPVLDDLGIKLTPMDLAKQYSKGRFDDSMIYAIKDLIKMSKSIQNFTKDGKNTISLDLGKFTLVSDKLEDSGKNFLMGKKSASSISDDDLKMMAPKSDDTSLANDASNELEKAGLGKEDSNWHFIWQQPSDIFKYLMGQDVDLVTYNMPKLSFDFNWDTFVRIWGPLGARLGVSFSASIDLAFGYDTLGIRQFIASDCKNYASLLNGFYVNDLDDNGYDKNELSFYGGLTASAELNAGVSAGVGGGVGINVGFNLYDPNKDGKIRLNEITNTVKYDGLFGLFDVNGKITAKLYAYVDLLFYTKKWNITGDKTLFSFDYEHSAIPVMAIKDDKGNVIASVGSNAGNRISTDDVNATLSDGDETLALDLSGNKVSWADGKRSEEVKKGSKLIVDAGAGKDTITLSGTADFDIEIYGGEGDDTIDLSKLTVKEGHAVIIWGGSGIDRITGAKGLNIVFGDTGVVRIDNDEKNKTRKYVIEANVEAGTAGDDIILGGSGRDIIIGGAGNDKIDGGEGDDIIFGDGGKIEFSVLDGESDSDIFKRISTVDIKNPNVVISRTDISADGGNDIIVGGSGNDFLYGGSGSDHIDGGSGDDVIYGERGNDYILGGSGNDIIHGGEGMDIILGDRLLGSIDVRTPFGENAFSQEFKDIFFKNDNSVLELDHFKASESKPSNDVGDAGKDYIYGEDGDDVIFGDSGTKDGADDYIEGGMGNDVIDADGGDDKVYGGIGNDVIYGGNGNDYIDGGAGNDSLYGDEGIKGYSRYKKKYIQKEAAFGENLGLLNGIYSDIQSTGAETGDDTIVTGPGMDFVDGQKGNDQVIVSFMGGGETSYANVTDSGSEDEVNSLTIEGTDYADTLLMRMHTENVKGNNNEVTQVGTFGFVALLPEDSSTTDESANTNIERVNFTKNIKTVNLNANDGDDKIYVDGTAENTNIDAGGGNDSIQIGQLYNSPRSSSQSVFAIDRFNTQKTSDEQYLSDGVNAGAKLNVEGGAGEDSFTVLHNVGDLSLSGGIGNDSFDIHSFTTTTKDGDNEVVSAIANGNISIDGGRGVDSMTVNGTNGDDVVVVTKDGMLSESIAVKAEGVESTLFNAAAGDDKFYVVSNNEGETTTINGGHGNDTVSIGGYSGNGTLRTAEADGHMNTVSYEIVSSNLTDEKYEVGSKFVDKYSVIDTSFEPVVLVSNKTEFIDSSRINVVEGVNTTFVVSYSGDLKGGCIAVDLSAPMLSEVARQNGDRDIILEYTDAEGVLQSGPTIRVMLSNEVKSVNVTVKTFKDILVEQDVIKSISINSYWGYYVGEDPYCIKLTKSCNSVSLAINDSVDGKLEDTLNAELGKLFTNTSKYSVNGESVFIGKNLNKDDLYVYVEKSNALSAADYEYNSSEGTLTLKNSADYDGKNLYVNYRSNTMHVDGSKIRLAYDNIGSIDYMTYNGQSIYSVDDENEGHSSDIRFKLSGSTISFVDGITHKLVNISGTVSINNAKWLEEDEGITTGSSKNANCDFLEFTPVDAGERSHILAEKSSDSDITNWTSSKFVVRFKETLKDDEAVSVKVSAASVISNMKNDGGESQHLGITITDSEGNLLKPEDDGSFILNFTKNQEFYSITVDAKHDDIQEEYGVVKFVADGGNTIDDVDGAVIANGEGEGVTTSVSDPQMLRYNHKIVDANGNVTRASQFDEKNNYDTDSLLTVASVSDKIISINASEFAADDLSNSGKALEGKTVKLIQGQQTSQWFRIEKIDTSSNDSVVILTLNDVISDFGNGKINAMLSGKKDYLFDSEDDNTDRIFINNQDSNKDAESSLSAVYIDQAGTAEGETNVSEKKLVTDSVRFTSTDLKDSNGVVANHFEYGEFNLGSGDDSVDISKTLYREDGFQTVTVVNAGEKLEEGKVLEEIPTENDPKQDDVITVSSYKEGHDGKLVINAQGGNDKITATDGVDKDGMIIFGGDGQDDINVAKGVIAFGDKGSVSYGSNDATLGYDTNGKIIRAKIDATGRENLQKETDGVVRAETSIKSVKDKEGAHDVITAGGEGSVIIGGFADDDITVTGERNVVLGDNGEVKFTDEGTAVTDWRENKKVVVSLDEVHTTSNDVGAKDTIKITGSSNVVMGGDGDDDITITGSDNVVLGDGGSAEFVNGGVTRENYVVNASIVSVETVDDKEGEADDIKITGKNNTVMGGAGGDTITIGEQGNNESGCKNVVLGDGGSYTIDRENKEVTVKTSREQIDDETVLIYGGVDTIDIYGGKNTVMGGTDGDKINVYGGDNIVLGDGGVAVREWTEDGSIFDSIKYVETTDDNDGGVDEVEIEGSKNVAMGGNEGDIINISGSDNVAVGDGGRYEVHGDYLTVNTKSEKYGGQDTITTEDGKNVVLGGMEADKLTTGKGNDIILGDGGFVMLDEDHNALFVTNTDYNTDGDEAKTGGADVIETTGGDNVIMGGMESDQITSGDGNDVIFGDNAYATFRGNAGLINTTDEKYTDVQKNLEFEDYTEIRTESILSFNFQGDFQNGLSKEDVAGAVGFESSNWNNVGNTRNNMGSFAGTYGNDDRELVYFDDGTRASAISVSYGGHEYNRYTSTDKDINLQSYTLGLNGAYYDPNQKLMNSGLMTTAPSNQGDNRLEVSVDGLSQYFTEYDVVVYLDVPDSHSAADQSVRRVSLWIDGVETDAYYVNDKAGDNYKNGLTLADEYNKAFGKAALTSETAKSVLYANYVVFHVDSKAASDRIVIKITDGFTGDNINGKDLPGIAGLQIKGKRHKQDVAASTNIDLGGDDNILSNGGDDIIVGGTGNDTITSFGDEHYGISDDDAVFGDNAKLLFTDRDSDSKTSTTLSSAESIAAVNSAASYNDVIKTGDGNDVVVGGIGGDTIDAGATATADEKIADVNVWSLNFTSERGDSSNSIAHGEAAGVVVDNDWTNMYVKNGSLHTLGSSGNGNNENVFKDISVKVSAYAEYDWDKNKNSSITHENYDELDGDTANSKLYNFYLAAQQQEEIKVSLAGISKQFSGNYDMYVYLGGDNNDTDTYNYLYQIALTYRDTDNQYKTIYRYLNDWTGQTFDGDYKEADCDNLDRAKSLMNNGSAPVMEIIGNYVVFRGVSGDIADIRIKNVYANGGQNPKNLPLVSAVQIVDSQNGNVAVGGDHDKDLVYGDDAKLTFDLDVPYAADAKENISRYENRVIASESMAINNKSTTGFEMVKVISTDDIITTGKDRDVVVGGEGADDIKTGLGDDIVIGGNANLIVEHNNPVGVFTPNTEIVMDQHTIDQTIHRNYLDNDNANIYEFQNRLNQHQIVGIDDTMSTDNDRYDTIDAGAGRNLISQGSWNKSELYEEHEEPQTPAVDEDDKRDDTDEPSTDNPSTDNPSTGDDNADVPSIGEDDKKDDTDEPSTDNPSTDNPSTGDDNADVPSTGGDDKDEPEVPSVVEVVEYCNMLASPVTLKAGVRTKVVVSKYFTSSDYNPNLRLILMNGSAGAYASMVVEYTMNGLSVVKQVNSGWYESFDIDDVPNDNGNFVFYITAKSDTQFVISVAQ